MVEEVPLIQVVLVAPGSEPVITNINSDLEGMQAVVEGLIQVVPIGGDLMIVCNEEGKLNDMPPNFFFPDKKDLIFGTCFFAKEEDGEIVGLDDCEAAAVIKIFPRLQRASGDEDPEEYLKIKIISWDADEEDEEDDADADYNDGEFSIADELDDDE